MLFLAVGIAMLAVAALAASAAADTTLGSKLEHSYETTFGGTTGIIVYQASRPQRGPDRPIGWDDHVVARALRRPERRI